MVEIKVISPFYDRENDLTLRKKGDVLTVTEERAKKLINLELAELFEKPKKKTKKTEEK